MDQGWRDPESLSLRIIRCVERRKLSYPVSSDFVTDSGKQATKAPQRSRPTFPMPAFKECGEVDEVPSPPPCLEGDYDEPHPNGVHTGTGYQYAYGIHPIGLYLNQYRAHQNRTLQSLTLNRDAASCGNLVDSFTGRRMKAPKHLRIGALGKPGQFEANFVSREALEQRNVGTKSGCGFDSRCSVRL